MEKVFKVTFDKLRYNHINRREKHSKNVLNVGAVALIKGEENVCRTQ